MMLWGLRPSQQKEFGVLQGLLVLLQAVFQQRALFLLTHRGIPSARTAWASKEARCGPCSHSRRVKVTGTITIPCS